MTLFAQILTGLGLAGAAGLNAYIPLLGVGLLARFGVITLAAPFDLLANTTVLLIVGVLLVLELVIDKVPALDHANDVAMTFVRPATGALLFAAGSGAITEVPAPLLLGAGLVTAFGVHATKAAARPLVNVGTGGLGAPVVSAVEDVVSVVVTVLAVVAPLLVLLLALLAGWAMVRVWRLAFRRKQAPGS